MMDKRKPSKPPENAPQIFLLLIFAGIFWHLTENLPLIVILLIGFVVGMCVMVHCFFGFLGALGEIFRGNE